MFLADKDNKDKITLGLILKKKNLILGLLINKILWWL